MDLQERHRMSQKAGVDIFMFTTCVNFTCRIEVKVKTDLKLSARSNFVAVSYLNIIIFFKEEVSLLISNKKSNYISSSNESFDDKEKEYSSTERIMDFHCHKISKSLDKGRGDATRTAKRKLFIACFLVLAFVILEVRKCGATIVRLIIIILSFKIKLKYF